jgi:hypothetical protein
VLDTSTKYFSRSNDLMKRIQWYFARGRAMSVREVVHRLRELAVKQLSRFLAPKVDAGMLSWTGNSKPLGDLMVTSWSDDLELRANWRRGMVP